MRRVARSLDGRTPHGAVVGSVVRVRGRVAELGFADAYQRRRGAYAAIRPDLHFIAQPRISQRAVCIHHANFGR